MLNYGFIQFRKQIKVDYTKWLGPDWVLTYENAGLYIQTHTQPLDFMCNEANMGKFVTFLSKEENRKVPVFGFIIEALGHLTISRDTKAVKSERNAMLDIIAER